MRVVSLVPSWTETLLEAGVEVVGRTRFCIHGPGVRSIPTVGGTKNWDLERILRLKPDLLILDREENPRFMAEQTDIPFHATHVQDLSGMPKILRELGGILKNSKLEDMGQAFSRLKRPSVPGVPGVIEWMDRRRYTNAIYIIWKDPWMAAGRGTYIGSVLAHCGVELLALEGKYPVVEPTRIFEETLTIFSSEPFPFLEKREGLEVFCGSKCFADGEKFSWFGVRSLRFLESLV